MLGRKRSILGTLANTPEAMRNEHPAWGGRDRWEWHGSTRKVRLGRDEGPRASTSTPTFPRKAGDS